MNYKKILLNLPYELQEKILNYYYKKTQIYKSLIKKLHIFNRYQYYKKSMKIRKISNSMQLE